MKRGHFYFAENRTFLLGIDRGEKIENSELIVDNQNVSESNTIQERTFQFAIRIIRMAKNLPKNPAGFSIADQIVKSGTSIGANVSEAQDAASKADFTHCLNISLKEARETEYWLKLIVESKLLSEQKMSALLAEIEEIVKILRASVKKLRSK